MIRDKDELLQLIREDAMNLRLAHDDFLEDKEIVLEAVKKNPHAMQFAAHSLQKDEELLSLDVQELLHRLYHEEDLRLYDAKSISFKCSCSQEKIENAVYSLGEEEANQLLKEQDKITIDCEFCNTKYNVDDVDVKRIFADKGAIKLSEDGSNTIH